jgi:hypothetical protein
MTRPGGGNFELDGCGRFERWTKREVEQRLARELEEALEAYRMARVRHKNVMDSVPSSIPAPDSHLRIHQAAESLNYARAAHQKALRRWTEFVAKGTIPDDA